MTIDVEDFCQRLDDAHAECCDKARYCLGVNALSSERFWSGRAAGIRAVAAMVTALLVENEYELFQEGSEYVSSISRLARPSIE